MPRFFEYPPLPRPSPPPPRPPRPPPPPLPLYWGDTSQATSRWWIGRCWYLPNTMVGRKIRKRVSTRGLHRKKNNIETTEQHIQCCGHLPALVQHVHHVGRTVGQPQGDFVLRSDALRLCFGETMVHVCFCFVFIRWFKRRKAKDEQENKKE